MRRQLLRVLCLALVFVAACQSWHATPLAPNVARDLPANTRLITSNGQTVQLTSGRVTSDSVIGEQDTGQRIALPRDSVASVEVRGLSWPRTLGAVYGGLFVLGLLIGEKF
ncbi:MAG TPA: hypothetical protein VLI40_06600 [Gemmatimonadaceae bacterium]|nr:hypothetical protein [Gemmatimonadaceae bacterium]